MSLGFRPIVILVDDGVYLAKADQDPGQSQWLSLGETLEEIIARGLYEKRDEPAEFCVENESLVRRDMNPEDLVEGLEPIDHEKVSALLASNRLQLVF
jgi:sulfur relay (sulfurtransferase) DsrF/TusC family protein